MARTKQTARRVMPTHDDVAAALVVSTVNLPHTRAPSSVPLSSRRCKSLCALAARASGGGWFAAPVDWRALQLHDYPSIVKHPMDLGTLSDYCATAEFDFATFLDRSRLVWANAVLYNPQGSVVATAALKIANLFEDAIVAAQVHAIDDDTMKLASVYGPLVTHLCEGLPSPVYDDPAYLHAVDVPTCPRAFVDDVCEHKYAHRNDVERDMHLLCDGLVAYHGANSAVGALAARRRVQADELFGAHRSDVDSRFLRTNALRMQLYENLNQLYDPAPTVDIIETLNPHACVQEGGGRTVNLDMLTLQQFFRIDTHVRRALVTQATPLSEESDYDDDSEDA